MLFCKLISVGCAYSSICFSVIAYAVYTRLPSDETTSSVDEPMVLDGDLELHRPLTGNSYFLEMCSSDGNRNRIPVQVAACEAEVFQSEVQFLSDQS